jgi:allantoate deiminase
MVTTSADRTLARLEALFAIDARDGANRPGLSAAEQRAHDLTAGWMAEAGLAVSVDGAGNLVGRAAGTDPGLPEVWTGSHLDTVPNGGRFDGALGVIAGLEAVAAAARSPHRRTIAVIAFRDEEGWRFGQGFFGSRALCGQLADGELEIRDAAGTSIGDALARLGLAPPGSSPGPLPGAFAELHIEQGEALAEGGLAVGVVSEIAAMAGLTVRFAGERAHAGGTAMSRRRDALVAAARFVVGAQDLARSDDRWRATVGELTVADPAANVIPEDVRLTVDARAQSDKALAGLVAGLRETAESAAAQAGCTAEAMVTWQEAAVGMSQQITAALAAAADGNGLNLAVPSWAGHDAGILAAAGVPTGMLFVRAGRAGLSHAPDETADAADIEIGIQTLARALTGLAGQGPGTA